MPEPVAKLAVEITAKVDGIRKGIQEATKSFDKMAADLDRIGGRLTRKITAPLLGGAVAVSKMAATFETEFAKIENLVGVSGDALEDLRKQTLALSGKVGRSPNELAKALFTVTSNGLRGAEAMKTLEAAAKASVVGLGDVATVSETLVKVTAAYEKQGLTAARATELLAAAVREGQLQTEELAGALTNVTGFAASAGVSFRDVAAFVATYSRSGKDASAATNDLRALIVALASPMEEAMKKTEGMAISVADISDTLRQKGLIPALIQLEEATGGNIDTMRKFLGSQEAMRGALAVLGSQSENLVKTWDKMGDGLSIVEAGFQKAGETATEKFKKAVAAVVAASIELGNVLLPVVKDVADAITNLGRGFASLGDTTKKIIIYIGALTAAMGPLMIATSRLITLFRALLAVNLSKGMAAIIAASETLYLKTLYVGDAFRRLTMLVKANYGQMLLWAGKASLWATAITAYYLALDKLLKKQREWNRVDHNSDVWKLSVPDDFKVEADVVFKNPEEKAAALHKLLPPVTTDTFAAMMSDDEKAAARAAAAAKKAAEAQEEWRKKVADFRAEVREVDAEWGAFQKGVEIDPGRNIDTDDLRVRLQELQDRLTAAMQMGLDANDALVQATLSEIGEIREAIGKVDFQNWIDGANRAREATKLAIEAARNTPDPELPESDFDPNALGGPVEALTQGEIHAQGAMQRLAEAMKGLEPMEAAALRAQTMAEALERSNEAMATLEIRAALDLTDAMSQAVGDLVTLQDSFAEFGKNIVQTFQRILSGLVAQIVKTKILAALDWDRVEAAKAKAAVESASGGGGLLGGLLGGGLGSLFAPLAVFAGAAAVGSLLTGDRGGGWANDLNVANPYGGGRPQAWRGLKADAVVIPSGDLRISVAEADARSRRVGG